MTDPQRTADRLLAWTTSEEPGWKVYGGTEPAYYSPTHGPLWMLRKGQRVRFVDRESNQVGPEQANVAPAVAYAQSQGWSFPIATRERVT